MLVPIRIRGLVSLKEFLIIVAATWGFIIAVFILAIWLCGCASTYPVKTTKVKLISPNMTMAQAASAPVLTIFSQQQGVLAMVCGAVVQYQNGEPAAVMPGNCNTPLAMVAAALGPLSIGLGAALWNNP